MELIESLIPDGMRQLSGAIARLEVAFKDAATDAPDGKIDGLDEFAKDFGLKDLISSPKSVWMKAGMPDKISNPARKARAEKAMREAHPEVKKE
jgi:hypothetical protein